MSVPRSLSQYSSEKSKIQYFENLNLTLNQLYSLFLDYYTTTVTGKFDPPLDIDDIQWILQFQPPLLIWTTESRCMQFVLQVQQKNEE